MVILFRFVLFFQKNETGSWERTFWGLCSVDIPLKIFNQAEITQEIFQITFLTSFELFHLRDFINNTSFCIWSLFEHINAVFRSLSYFLYRWNGRYIFKNQTTKQIIRVCLNAGLMLKYILFLFCCLLELAQSPLSLAKQTLFYRQKPN